MAAAIELARVKEWGVLMLGFAKDTTVEPSKNRGIQVGFLQEQARRSAMPCSVFSESFVETIKDYDRVLKQDFEEHNIPVYVFESLQVTIDNKHAEFLGQCGNASYTFMFERVLPLVNMQAQIAIVTLLAINMAYMILIYRELSPEE